MDFHGDVFDASVNHAKWIAKLGGLGYDYLILSIDSLIIKKKKIGKNRILFEKK
jgi:hypothetical protein